jgi:hypothetical protein
MNWWINWGVLMFGWIHVFLKPNFLNWFLPLFQWWWFWSWVFWCCSYSSQWVCFVCVCSTMRSPIPIFGLFLHWFDVGYFSGRTDLEWVFWIIIWCWWWCYGGQLVVCFGPINRVFWVITDYGYWVGISLFLCILCSWPIVASRVCSGSILAIWVFISCGYILMGRWWIMFLGRTRVVWNGFSLVQPVADLSA